MNCLTVMQIPVTRPKSPKLGRNKSTPATSPKGNGTSASQSVRLRIDSKVSQNSLAKESLHCAKKPLRKSLPKSTLPNPTDNSPEAPSGPQNIDDSVKTVAAKQSQTKVKPDEPSTAEEQPNPVEQESVNGAALDQPSEGQC